MRTPSRSAGPYALALLLLAPLVGRGQGPVWGEDPASPWHVDAEFAVLFNVATQHTGNAYWAALASPVGQLGLASATSMVWPGPAPARDDHHVFVSPRVFLSYDFDGCGSARLTYRNLTRAGTVNRVGDPYFYYGGWSSRTTFTANWADLDYVSAEFSPAEGWRLRCEAGGRFVHFHSGFRDDSPYWRSDTTFNYFGGGPHLGLTSNCAVGDSCWDLFARADAGVTFGGRGGEYRSESKPGPYYDAILLAGPYVYRTSVSAYQFDFNLQLGAVGRWQVGGYDVGLGLGVQAEVLSFGVLNARYADHGTFGFVNVGPFVRSEVSF